MQLSTTRKLDEGSAAHQTTTREAHCRTKPTTNEVEPVETMSTRRPSNLTITNKLQGQQLSRVDFGDDGRRLTLHFSGGISLTVDANPAGLQVAVEQIAPPEPSDPDVKQPTKRQLDYLLFIDKYVKRFGRAPAEADIERHFSVSPPSVNQMMKMLERQGFITRTPGTPRSARICIDLGTGPSRK